MMVKMFLQIRIETFIMMIIICCIFKKNFISEPLLFLILINGTGHIINTPTECIVNCFLQSQTEVPLPEEVTVGNVLSPCTYSN